MVVLVVANPQGQKHDATAVTARASTIYKAIKQGDLTLGIDTLGVGIDLQALLRHLRVLQEIQRHPYQMPLDLVQFLSDLLGWHERIVQMSLLELVVAREEGAVVIKRFDCVNLVSSKTDCRGARLHER